MKKGIRVFCIAFLAMLLACTAIAEEAAEGAEFASFGQPSEGTAGSDSFENGEEEGVALDMMKMKIGDTPVEVAWENNDAVEALKELAAKGLIIQMSRYGGFEQVGSLGQRLPSSDVQTSTAAGDIVLYSGDQLVVFYGSNSWAYTRLGHITDKTPEEMRALLGFQDVVITLSVE